MYPSKCLVISFVELPVGNRGNIHTQTSYFLRSKFLNFPELEFPIFGQILTF